MQTDIENMELCEMRKTKQRNGRTAMSENIFTTKKKYQIIYADPPWEYKESGGGHRGTAGLPYETMKTEDICSLPVSAISANDALLYLWTTDTKIKEAFKVMEAWGFTYKGIVYCWVKQNRKSDSIFWGMGRYSRKNIEIVLLGIRGNAIKNFPPIKKNSHQVVYERIREHSRKPEKIRNEIVAVIGDVPRIELFARESFEGWDCWGNEV